jgi:hypothetical protein
MAIQSLFGPSPAEVQELRRQQEEKEILASGGEFGAFAPLYQAGLRFGSAGRQAMAPLMGAQDPMLQKATAIQGVLAKYQGQNLNSAEVMSNIAKDLSTVDMEAGLKAAEIAKKLAPEGFKPSTSFGEVAQELGFGAKTNLNEYTPAQAAAINREIQSRKEREQKAGVPQAGQVDITSLARAQDVVDQYTKGPSEKLANITPLRTQLNQAKAGSGAAFEQVRGQLIKLVGDSQISNAERARITGSSGIIEDAVNKVQTLMQGVPTQAKLNEIERIVVALEDVYANQFNRGVDKSKTVLDQAKFSPETRAALVPSRYVSAAEKARASKVKPPAVGTIQNGFKFKGGNPADKNNWEPVTTNREQVR